MEQLLAVIVFSMALGMALAGYIIFNVGKDIRNHPINGDKGTGPIAMILGSIIMFSMSATAILVFIKSATGAI